MHEGKEVRSASSVIADDYGFAIGKEFKDCAIGLNPTFYQHAHNRHSRFAAVCRG